MNMAILVVMSIMLAMCFIVSVTTQDDEHSLTDKHERDLEEARKRLLEREEKDVELDND